MFEKDAEERITEQFGTSGEYVTRQRIWQDGAKFGYDQCKDKLDIAIEIIEQMKDLFFDCWQERGLNAIKFEQKVNDFLKENK